MRVRMGTGAIASLATDRCTRWVVLAGVTALVVGAAALAGAAAIGLAQSAEVADPGGDIKNNDQPWQDVLSGGVVRQGNTFTFSMKMAAALPADPPAASGGLGWYMWLWGIDSDPDLAPAGWPFTGNDVEPHEFFVILASDGEQYFAFVGDRRPLAEGGDPVITPVPFRIRGSSIQVSVNADLLDNPADFLWSFGSVTSHAHLGAEGFEVVDVNDAGFVPWPQN